jgi:hypothetical protein
MHPKFFGMEASSRLYVETVSGLRREHPGWVSLSPPGPVSIGADGGTVWTPTISCLDGLLIVQETLATEMLEAGLTGLDECYPVTLRTDWPTPIHKKGVANAPKYVWFRVARDTLVDPREFVWPTGMRPVYGMPYRRVPVPGSHGGRDIFGVKNQEWGSFYCSWRFVSTARSRKWKGFQFEPMDVPPLSRVDLSVHYLKDPWPPERWYPEGIEGHPNNLEPY